MKKKKIRMDVENGHQTKTGRRKKWFDDNLTVLVDNLKPLTSEKKPTKLVCVECVEWLIDPVSSSIITE